MKNNASFVYAIFLAIGDFLALVAAFTVAYILRVKLDTRPLIEQITALDFFFAFLAVLPLWIIVHAFIGLYTQKVYEKRFVEMGRLLVGSFLGILVVIGYDFVIEGELFPARLVPAYAFLLSFGLLVAFRNIARGIRHALFRYGIGVSNVLILGDNPVTDRVASLVENTNRSGIFVAGLVGRPQNSSFTNYQNFTTALKEVGVPIHGVIQTELSRSPAINNEVLQFCRTNHVSYRFVPGNSDLFVGNIEVDLFAEFPMIAVHPTPLTGWGRVVKRVFDVLVSTLLLSIFSPVFFIVAVLQKLTDPSGDVFFRQTRLTRFNKEFKVYKFRTHLSKYNGMSPEAAFKTMGKPELAKLYRANGDFLINDPRVSPWGRFLRITSLDELPQLFNVLKGDLSLVGPRALVPEEINSYERKHTVLAVKSGITGLAQVSGRRDISFEERRKLDVYYVQNWTFWLDISILMRTLRAVINGSGAK